MCIHADLGLTYLSRLWEYVSARCENPMEKFKKCLWPFSSEYAKTIECYVTKAPRAKLYIFQHTIQEPYQIMGWQYCMDAGANNERSHSGFITRDDIPAVEAVSMAIQQVKKCNSWEL